MTPVDDLEVLDKLQVSDLTELDLSERDIEEFALDDLEAFNLGLAPERSEKSKRSGSSKPGRAFKSQRSLRTQKSVGRLESRPHEGISGDNLFFEIALIELNREFLRQWGARFGSPVDFDLILKPRLGLQAFQFAGLNPIGGFVDFALDQGKGRIHFKQSLLTRVGRLAEFNVGGDFPIRVSNRHHAGLSKISYGMNIRLLPVQKIGSEILLELSVLVREPVSGGIDSLPRISEKKLETDFKMKMNESLTIAGFFHETEVRKKKGLAFLSEVPVLGDLFSSHEFRNHQSEAFFVITPKRMIDQRKVQ